MAVAQSGKRPLKFPDPDLDPDYPPNLAVYSVAHNATFPPNFVKIG